jgi:uncharacterized protein DUF1566
LPSQGCSAKSAETQTGPATEDAKRGKTAPARDLERPDTKRELPAGVYLDPETKLMWTKEDNGRDIDWHEANEYAKQLRQGGHSDWRLPTIEELEKLYDPKAGIQYNIKKPFKLTGFWVWSSTTKGSDSAYYFHFLGGLRGLFHPTDISARAVCVRQSSE